MEVLVDTRYEFDAPQHYDFEAENTDSQGSSWFAAQEEGVPRGNQDMYISTFGLRVLRGRTH